MAKFRHEKPKPRLFPKKQQFFKAISSLYAAKASCFNNAIKRLKLILSLFWVPLSPKTSKQVFFRKKSLRSTLCYCNLLQKIRKVLSVNFLGGPFWPLNLQNIIFIRNMIKSSFKITFLQLHAKNHKSFTRRFFIKLEKLYFWSILGSFGQKIPEQNFKK